MGVYCFNDYCRLDCKDDLELFRKKQNSQADKTLELLKNKKVDYPVYLDIEQTQGLSEETFTKSQVREMLNIWYSKISGAGYIPGIYCNTSGYQYLQSCVDFDISEEFQVWIAGGDQYTGETEDIDLKNIIPSDILDKDFVTMCQSTDSCINAGAENSAGHLDIDFSKIDYTNPTTITTKGKDPKFEIKDYTRINGKAIGLGTGSALGIAGIVGGGILLHKLKKNKANKKTKRK